jgi:putative acetyltransferase
MIPDLKICLVTKEDLDRVRELFFETIHAINQKDYSPKQVEVWASAAENLNEWSRRIEDQYFIGATIKSKIVGFASLDYEGYLDFMFVHKDFQKSGIASALLDELLRKGSELKLGEIYTEASITARPFFEKKGFQLIKENSKVFKGEEFINYKMKRILAN